MKATLKARDGRTLTVSSEPPSDGVLELGAFAYITIDGGAGELTFPIDADGAGAIVGALFGLGVKAGRSPFR